MKELSVLLPVPPSTNMMFVNSSNATGRGRYPSVRYKAWRTTAARILTAKWQDEGRPQFHPPMQLEIRIGINHQGDITNRIKAIEDLFVKTIPGFPDDRHFEDVRITRVKMDGARAIVRPWDGEVWS